MSLRCRLADGGGDDCPSTLDEAWNNGSQAGERWKEIKGEYRTTGLYYDSHGERHKYQSG